MSTSEAADGGPIGRKTRFRRIVIGLVLVVLVAIAVVVWQQGGAAGGGPLNAIAEAAEKTEHEPGGHAATHAIITAADGKKIVMTGTSVFDDAGRISGVFTFPNPQSGGRTTMRMVGDGSAIYMSSGMFGRLPGGAKWMGLDLSPGEAPAATVPTTGDAEEGLKLLEGVDDVERLRSVDVRGVPTTRYRGVTGPADKLLHVEAWIDGDGRILRMRLVNSPSRHGGETSSRLDMRTDFFDFGPVPPIKAPDPSEVFDGTALGES